MIVPYGNATLYTNIVRSLKSPYLSYFVVIIYYFYWGPSTIDHTSLTVRHQQLETTKKLLCFKPEIDSLRGLLRLEDDVHMTGEGCTSHPIRTEQVHTDWEQVEEMKVGGRGEELKYKFKTWNKGFGSRVFPWGSPPFSLGGTLKTIFLFFCN